MKNVFIPKRFMLFFLVVICAITVSNPAHSGNITVRPGKFDHFVMQLPEKIRAGEGVMIKLQAYDAHDNLITDFGEAGKDFKISISGSAQVQPAALKAVSFTGGAASITLTDKKAESVTLSISESVGTVPVITKEIIISPNKLDRFFVQAPQSVIAGNNFDVKIIAKDAFDNPISDEIESRNIKITSSGTTGFKVVNMPHAFRNGEGIATLMSEKIGEVAVEVQDITAGSRGSCSGIKVMPAMLGYFKVYAPNEAVAGDAFEITISPFDAFDNPINNYASYGGGVTLSSTGQSKLSPSFVGQTDFRNGQAVIKLKYEKAEEISIIATENNKSQQGKSTSVKVNPAAPDNFIVITPDAAVAGQKFRVKIEVYDKFNNLVKNYNLAGNDVYLNATGSGTLSPKAISASEFSDGVASVDVVYDKAESFAISASMSTKREEKRAVVREEQKETKKEQKEEKVSAPKTPVVKPVEKAVAPKPVVTEKPKIETQPVAEEKPLEKPVEKIEKEAAAAPKEEKVAKKEPVKEPAKEKIAKEKLFEVKKVSLIEAKNKAMIIINTTATEAELEYKEEMESNQGKDWIKIRVKPAVNMTKKDLWKFKSVFVGDIRIEEDKKETGVLNIRIETLIKQSSFDVNLLKGALVVSVTGP